VIFYVRDEDIEGMLMDLCKKLGVKLVIKGELKAIDNLISALENSDF